MSHLIVRPTRAVDRLAAQIAALTDRVAELEQQLTSQSTGLAADHVQALLNRFRAEALQAGRHALELSRADDELPPELYLALENRFRGDPADIRRDQEPYVDDIVAVDSEAPVVDLGCGRGEFLALLGERGITAFGVDSNSAMVHEATGAGGYVRHESLLGFLEAAEPSSLRAITMFHVAEHLPLSDLFAVLGHARRILVPGGCFIAETPNISNLAVAASGFWLDPTHIRPLHPELLQFLASAAGFEAVEARYLHPVLPAPEPSTAGRDALIRRMVTHIYGAQDFTVVARRAA